MAQHSNIAIFASGTGTNAENIIRYFNFGEHGAVRVSLVVCNKADAQVLQRAASLGVPTEVVSASELRDESSMLALMGRYAIDAVVLAGFLLMIPQYLTARYEGRMVNIHPSLLPRHGGKGMYGMRVHEAVVASGDKETGITIHLVSERYDEGAILFQAATAVSPSDTPADVARKVQQLEQTHFPCIIAEWLDGMGML